MSPTVHTKPVATPYEDIVLPAAIGIIGALGLGIGVLFTGRLLEAGLGALMVLFSGWALVSTFTDRSGRRSR